MVHEILADLSVYHPLWALRTHPDLAKALSGFPRIGHTRDRRVQ